MKPYTIRSEVAYLREELGLASRGSSSEYDHLDESLAPTRLLAESPLGVAAIFGGVHAATLGAMGGALGAAGATAGHYATRLAAGSHHKAKMKKEPHLHAADLMQKVGRADVHSIDTTGSAKYSRGIARAAVGSGLATAGTLGFAAPLAAPVGAASGIHAGLHVARLKALEKLKKKNPEAFAKAKKLAGMHHESRRVANPRTPAR